MNVFVAAMAGMLSIALCAGNGYAYQRVKRHKEPNLPGIIHSAPCVQVAPGVYDCGDHKNHNRKKVPKSGRWKITVRPTDDITITAKSKAEREAEKANR